MKNLEQIRKEAFEFFNNEKINFRLSENQGNTICYIEQSGKQNRFRSDYFDGLQITCFSNGVFEVSEYSAGENENELHIFTETKSLKIALKSFMKGNKRKPIKIWD